MKHVATVKVEGSVIYVYDESGFPILRQPVGSPPHVGISSAIAYVDRLLREKVSQ
jgi:hypothetical protein